MGLFGLSNWEDIAADGDWPVLVAGNGASRAVTGKFAYPSLFAVANLNDDDRALFDMLGTANFEDVIRSLDVARFVCVQMGLDVGAIDARHEAVRHALVETVNHHHVAWHEVEGPRLLAIKAALREFNIVFTTSYDLLFYWAMNFEGADDFLDHFWHYPDNHFEADDSPVWANRTAVHWLHGGLHIYRWGVDGTAKRVNDGAALLAQFADGGHLPLYVAEGTAEQKRQAIRRSDYLTYCFETLEADERDLVIFGQALGPYDQHLVDSVKVHVGRRIAYGVYPTNQVEVDLIVASVKNLLNEQVKFFDSTTFPLGVPALAVP